MARDANYGRMCFGEVPFLAPWRAFMGLKVASRLDRAVPMGLKVAPHAGQAVLIGPEVAPHLCSAEIAGRDCIRPLATLWITAGPVADRGTLGPCISKLPSLPASGPERSPVPRLGQRASRPSAYGRAMSSIRFGGSALRLAAFRTWKTVAGHFKNGCLRAPSSVMPLLPVCTGYPCQQTSRLTRLST